MAKDKLDKYSDHELREAYYQRRYQDRHRRLNRLRKQGRVVESKHLRQAVNQPDPELTRILIPNGSDSNPSQKEDEKDGERSIYWRWVVNGFLLIVEIGAVIGFVAIVWNLRGSMVELNQEIAQAQQQVINSEPIPTATLPPVISMVVLPSGHQPPVEGRPIVYEEAGDIPSHLFPLVDAYIPPPIPTPSASQPRQIKIDKIEVNAPIFQGHEEEQLKKGVGHSIGTANPGNIGNMVLSAHNDIYGEIFRNLDQLESGDEIVVSNGRQSYTYLVNFIDVVPPTAVEVMAPTDHSSLTLISCYPYLINNKRIIIKADLVESS